MEKRRDAICLSLFADGSAGLPQPSEAAQETAVRFMTPGHRSMPLPAIATQCIKASVVTDTRKGIDLDRLALLGRLIGECGPRQ